MSQRCDHKATSRWTARVIPVILAGVIGYATYVLVKVLIVDYLLRDGPTRSPGAAIAILVVFFLFLLLVVSSYIRILSTIATNPGYIPLGAAAQKRLVEEKQGGRSEDPISREHYSEEYQLENSNPRGGQPPDSNPDSPGLETFYTKDIFVCERDGRPKWCSECANWKPDRTHHCSDIGRCIRKMDHFCPWVGGSVGETNFKFFIQFVSYTCIMCLIIVIVMAYYVKKVEAVESLVQPAVILGLAGFFGLFTGGMAVTSIRFALLNLTTIENLNYKHKVWDLAVAIPPREELERIRPPGSRYPTPTYRTITFPLDFNNNLENLPTSDANLEDLETLRRRQQERLSERDHRATRVFAVLSTEPGEHPWDLGSKLENWKTVMGDNVLDWMLPVRRSPCCDHDDPISHFRLGPAVDLLLAKHGFIGPSEVRRKGTYRPESGKRGYPRSSATEKNVPNGVAQ